MKNWRKKGENEILSHCSKESGRFDGQVEICEGNICEGKFVRAILHQDETSLRTDFFKAATAIYKVFSGYQVREVAK